MTMDFDQLKRVLEAALLAAGQPLTLAQLGALIGEDMPVGHDELARAIESLQQDAENRGIELREVASGFRYQVREDVHPWVSRLWTERPTRYTRALLETLALIAYRQPITRAEIEQIRGVTVSSSIVKTLEEREWVRIVGYRDVPGKPALFGTTRSFLDYFNLKSLDELPPLAEIRDLDEFDPQLTLGSIDAGAPVPAAESPGVIENGTVDDVGEAIAAESENATDIDDTDSAAFDDTDFVADDDSSTDQPFPDTSDSAAAAVDATDDSMASDDAPEHTA